MDGGVDGRVCGREEGAAARKVWCRVCLPILLHLVDPAVSAGVVVTVVVGDEVVVGAPVVEVVAVVLAFWSVPNAVTGSAGLPNMTGLPFRSMWRRYSSPQMTETYSIWPPVYSPLTSPQGRPGQLPLWLSAMVDAALGLLAAMPPLASIVYLPAPHAARREARGKRAPMVHAGCTGV